MDTVIAKLDSSVFGMLTDQEPRIMIDAVCSSEEIELVNRLKPDFIRLDSEFMTNKKASSCVMAPGIRILTTVDDIPLYSSAHDKKILSIDTKADVSKLPEMIKRDRPDLLVIKLDAHDDEALASLKKLVRSIRSTHQDFVD